MMISKKNIRATAYSEFWGTEFEESIYLWEGAKHQIPLNEWDKINSPTLKDQFATKEEIDLAHEYCKKVYLKILPAFAAKLNEIHQLDLPVSFWRTVCGRWLFEHTCVVYEKYAYLSQLDLDHTSIKLLDKASFYTPNDFTDSYSCFSSDFGVQQLVSHYYYLYSRREFPTISKKFDFNGKSQRRLRHSRFFHSVEQSVKKVIRSIFLKVCQPKMLLLRTCFYRELIRSLTLKSKGKIQRILLPEVDFFSGTISYEKRRKLLDIETEETTFEYFLVQTFYYNVPRAIIEYFNDCYRGFLKDIRSKRFEYITSEVWIGHFPTAIYVAIAQQLGKKLIFPQHGAFTQIYYTNLEWLQFSIADIYLTGGWKSNSPKAVSGGFACRKITPYRHQPWKRDILYVAGTFAPYLRRFGDLATNNSCAVESLKITRNFIELLPDHLGQYFVFRPRTVPYYWNIKHALQVEKRAIRLDDDMQQELSLSLSNAKIVILDHLSTGLAELLAMEVPFLILHNNFISPLADEYEGLFAELAGVGVVHGSAQSAITQLVQIYGDVQKWWNSRSVQTAVNKLKSKTIGTPSKTMDYLLSCTD